MIARPIPFSPPMVRATLDGRKTQTRRDAHHPFPNKKGHKKLLGYRDLFGATHALFEHGDLRCPYGKAGDLLWVREAWRVGKPHDQKRASEILEPLLKRGKGVTVLYEAGGWRSVGPADRVEPIYLDDEPMPKWAGKYRHARFMPRWASRLTLRITEIRVERLQEISAEDCIAEGLSTTFREHDAVVDLRRQYRELWESINGPDSWAANPWVWVIGFDVLKSNVDAVLKEAA